MDEAARAAEVGVLWRPFLLGPNFADLGWRDSPFNLYPAKGALWRDMARRAARMGLAFYRPDPFPQRSLRAAHGATAALDRDPAAGAAFCRAVFAAQFGRRAQIDDLATLRDCLARSGLPAALVTAAGSEAVKVSLRASTDAARAAGTFGAPSFTVDGQLFWGDDQRDAALDWAARGRPRERGPG